MAQQHTFEIKHLGRNLDGKIVSLCDTKGHIVGHARLSVTDDGLAAKGYLDPTDVGEKIRLVMRSGMLRSNLIVTGVLLHVDFSTPIVGKEINEND